jgi:ABC-type uncharacterized transport system permease subunit
VKESLAVELIVSGILFGTPILFAALGELLSQRGGVLNLGVEGMMLMGAVAAVWGTTIVTGSSAVVLLFAVMLAVVAGVLTALLFAFAVITLGANQLIAGLAIWIMTGALGLSSYLASGAAITGQRALATFSRINVFGLKDVPIVGPIFFHHNALVYLSWLFVAMVSFYLYRTRYGLNLRAIGEEPRAADAVGISVVRYRYIHTLLGGAGAGLGGAFFTLAISPVFVDGVTAGYGWIAIALVIFAFWRPVPLMLGAYVFGLLAGLGVNLQARGIALASEAFNSLPYLMTIAVLVLASSVWAKTRHGAPKSLGLSYSREAH